MLKLFQNEENDVFPDYSLFITHQTIFFFYGLNSTFQIFAYFITAANHSTRLSNIGVPNLS